MTRIHRNGSTNAIIWTPALDAAIRTGAEARRSMTAVGAELGISSATVSARATKLGIDWPPLVPKRTWDDPAWAARFRDVLDRPGVSYDRASKEMRCSYETVRLAAKALGIVTNSAAVARSGRAAAEERRNAGQEMRDRRCLGCRKAIRVPKWRYQCDGCMRRTEQPHAL